MDNEKNRKKSLMTMVLWIVLMVFDISATILLIIWGGLKNEVLIASIVLSVFLLALGVFAIWKTYRNYIEPEQKDEKTGKTTYEIREAKIHKRRKGRDMFEVCDNYRKQYFTTMYIVIGVFSLLLPFVFILKLNEYESIHIPFWWAFIAAAVIMGISFIAAGKTDFAFYSSMNLKFEIRRNGFDEFYVNNDFMMATYHDLLKGFMAIGQSYYVVFMQKFCRVAEMNNIVIVEHFAKEYKLNSQIVVRHFIRVIERNNVINWFACADELAADLIISEFNRAGIPTALLPTEKAMN